MTLKRKLHILGAILAVLILCTAASAPPETIQAQAFGTTTMAGKTFGITINIESYSTPADQKVLIDAFQRGGHSELVKAVSKMKGRGRVRLSSGGVGYQIAYIRNIETPQGRTIRLMTDRPISIAEAMFSTRSEDYDLSLIELQLTNGKDSTGTLVPGGRFKVNKNKQIEFESYSATPWRLAGIQVR